MEHLATQTLYEILEVAPDAPQEEIHRAFLRAKTTYSPNCPALYSTFSKDEAEEFARLINEAYAVLGNPSRRREYDDLLKDNKPDLLEPQIGLVTPEPVSTESRDHAIPEAQQTWAADTVQTQNPPQLSILPSEITDASKLGHTQFSHYEIDAAFEKEIVAQEIFDGTLRSQLNRLTQELKVENF